jgi:glycosyltransferase involved in cell wall biosynthesis
VVSSRINEGKGAAVRRGMLAARGRVRAFVDADGSAAPSALPALVDEVRSGRSDVAIASRYVGAARPHGQPPWRLLLSRACHRMIQATLLPGIADPYCGMKVFSCAAAEAVFVPLRFRLWAFDVEALARARRAGLRITEHPIAWRDDGRSTVRLRHAWPTLREALQIPGWLRDEAR